MRSILKLTGLGFLLISSILYSCKKESVTTVPTLTTSAITNISTTTAACGGTIINEGAGTILTRGVCWSTGTNPTVNNKKTQDGAGAGTFTSNMTALNGGTVYFVRAYATNNSGTGYGMAMSFKTLGQSATIYTLDATNIMETSVRLNGTVKNNLLSTIITFEYGTTMSYGTSIPVSQNPVIDTITVNLTADLTGLTPNTLYHYRGKAVNSAGTSYGGDKTFTTTQSLTDVDGNNYNTIIIGNQTWMLENLKTTKYNDDSSIPLVTDNTTWTNLTTAGYCFYDNDPATYKSTYGAMYNWYAVNTGKLCPTEWHVPSDAEWKQLEMYLGMSQSDANLEAWRSSGYVGNKIREIGTAHWLSLNPNATNESGFTALPGGIRNSPGNYQDLGISASFWSSDPYSTIGGWGRCTNGYESVYRGGLLIHYGGSVRCIKD